MERKVSAMTSNRASASRTRDSGPLATIQEAFICGSAQILLRPLRTKVRQGDSEAAKLCCGEGDSA